LKKINEKENAEERKKEQEVSGIGSRMKDQSQHTDKYKHTKSHFCNALI
jgi:hypothetical protein